MASIHLSCPAENRVIGTVTRIGASLDAGTIRRGYEPEPGYALGADDVKDGVQLLCPRCKNPVVIRADDVDLYVVPGTFRIAEARSEDGAAAG